MSRSHLIEIALAIAAAAAGCRQGRDRPPPMEHEQALRVIGACVKALAETPHDAPMKNYPDACSSIAHEARCRDAMARPADLTGAWPASMIDACAAAYCPQLPAPKPRACRAKASSVDDWGELWASIMLFEVGLDDPGLRRKLDEVFAPVTATVTRSAPPPAPPPSGTCDATVIVTLLPSGAAIEGASVVAIAPCGGALDHAAIATELCRAIDAATCAPQLTLRVDGSIAHGEVVALLDLAKSAGVTRIALGTDATALPAGADDAPARCGEPAPARCP